MCELVKTLTFNTLNSKNKGNIYFKRNCEHHLLSSLMTILTLLPDTSERERV